MLLMAETHDQSPPSDVCLLLRSHAEARWLSHEVVPLLCELEQEDLLSEDQLAAALAYLEVQWIEARGRALETEATRAELDPVAIDDEDALHGWARRYHRAVSRLRDTVARRVAPLVATPRDAPAHWPITDRHAST
jgi:hypothetical protein